MSKRGGSLFLRPARGRGEADYQFPADGFDLFGFEARFFPLLVPFPAEKKGDVRDLGEQGGNAGGRQDDWKIGVPLHPPAVPHSQSVGVIVHRRGEFQRTARVRHVLHEPRDGSRFSVRFFPHVIHAPVRAASIFLMSLRPVSAMNFNPAGTVSASKRTRKLSASKVKSPSYPISPRARVMASQFIFIP